ncbi:MAG: FIST C-terminal domain-containing protein [Rubrobacteraceae bacterium]|nr:FIST C-terminal domain-containing protein [Rubrobacteraceae bacterium]MBA3615495.1 FIST C-terminal domain-containing protein [Rubrobacteraceae bacterium]MDQ3438377.1 FIST C-terminal domain-containing protein [Actinomycetota bacterium]
MATKAGVGMSRHHNPNLAGREAAQQALKNAGVAKPDFVFMFASIGYDQRSLLRTVREATGGAPLSGCSAEGTINGDEADESGFSVVVTAISSDELRWTNGLARGLEDDARAVGQQVAQDLMTDLSADTIGLFVFPDGLITLTLENFLAGLEENLSTVRFLPLWGGGAGNNLDTEGRTYQYCDDEVVSGGISYALLSGKAQAGWAISHGLVPIGGERIVTRSHGNVIYEIDGKPAVEVLKEYLPEHALTEERDWMRYAISLALCFRAPSYMKDEEYVVRGVPALRMADGSIIVQTEVSEGTSVWFSSRDKEKITTGFDRMAAQIKDQLGGEKPKLVFQFECLTRGKTMFREQEKLQILKRFRKSLDPEAPWAGFYTIGEIGPVEEHNDLHLFTSVVLALS